MLALKGRRNLMQRVDTERASSNTEPPPLRALQHLKPALQQQFEGCRSPLGCAGPPHPPKALQNNINNPLFGKTDCHNITRWIIFCVVEMLKRSRKHAVRIGGAFRGWMDLTRSKRLVVRTAHDTSVRTVTRG